MTNFLFLTFLIFSISSFSQTDTTFITGSETSNLINDTLPNDSVVGPSEGNWVFHTPSAPQLNKLFVMLPGTNSLPSWHKTIGTHAANLGYHSIVLRYPSTDPIFVLCGASSDTNCHEKARLEIITGQNLSTLVNINIDNSIINRLTKLLQHLMIQQPSKNWDQFITGNNIEWDKIVISGHSQGGGHAGVIGKNYKVDRVVMFSASDWQSGNVPPWVSNPGLTDTSDIYGFCHWRDEAGFFGPPHIMIQNWQAYGINTFGASVFTDSTSYPFNLSHMLITDSEPLTYNHWFHDDKYHNGVVVDPWIAIDGTGEPTHKYVWDYLLENTSYTSIKQYKKDNLEINLYPNPTTGITHLNVKKTSNNYTVKLVNRLGQVINIKNNQNIFDLTNLNSGTYFFILKNNDSVLTKKVVKL